MFERFSKQSRGAVMTAQTHAREAGAPQVTTVHLALALLEQDPALAEALHRAGADQGLLGRHLREAAVDGGLDRDALASVGIDLDAVVDQTERVFGLGALQRGTGRGGTPSWGRDSKKALELALREAIHLGDRAIEPRHLLLGIVRGDGPGRAALVAGGADVEALRAELQTPPATSA